jgi:hypothetical protein
MCSTWHFFIDAGWLKGVQFACCFGKIPGAQTKCVPRFTQLARAIVRGEHINPTIDYIWNAKKLPLRSHP